MKHTTALQDLVKELQAIKASIRPDDPHKSSIQFAYTIALDMCQDKFQKEQELIEKAYIDGGNAEFDGTSFVGLEKHSTQYFNGTFEEYKKVINS